MDSNTIGLETKKRLIVFVPEGAAGNPDMAKKIYWMALRDHRDVVYLALIDQYDQRDRVSRHIATMKALTADESVKVTSKYSLADEWLSTLNELYRPGDSIVCHEEQRIRAGFLATTPMHVWLSNLYKAPIHTISGFYHPWRVLSHKLLYSLAFWVGCIVILGFFSFLEIQIDQTVKGLAHSILLFVALAFEFGSLLVWNRFTKI
jgi:hypothetical protein